MTKRWYLSDQSEGLRSLHLITLLNVNTPEHKPTSLKINFDTEAESQVHPPEHIKGIVHFEIKFWYVLAYLKGIQEVVSILIFIGQTVRVCQSYNGGLWSPPQRACTEKSKLNMI